MDCFQKYLPDCAKISDSLENPNYGTFMILQFIHYKTFLTNVYLIENEFIKDRIKHAKLISL